LELGVNLVKSTTEIGELLASLIQDQKLCHSIPIEVPSYLECYIVNFLHRFAHFHNDFALLLPNMVLIPPPAACYCAHFHTQTWRLYWYIPQSRSSLIPTSSKLVMAFMPFISLEVHLLGGVHRHHWRHCHRRFVGRKKRVSKERENEFWRSVRLQCYEP